MLGFIANKDFTEFVSLRKRLYFKLVRDIVCFERNVIIKDFGSLFIAIKRKLERK
ncbi:hypothetical protein ACPB8Q_06980 [Methanocaldococcus indicus]|uniref:hypothetical protein n=1 Tax=Methanocaldococcus indicus TaxID=213231 RepID=UPI003C6D4DDB